MSLPDPSMGRDEDDGEGGESEKYYGKFRGIVVNNIDPEQRGRIQVIVPDVSTIIPTTWAMPCVPVAGMQMGFFAVPLIGAGVWIEFEQGDPDYPIWVGCFYGTAAEVPTLARSAPSAVPSITLQTPLKNGITVNDLPGETGGIILRSATGASIIVNDTGIYLRNGKGATIVMVGPSVNINNEALKIT
jgi:uncharacterized protein involved in type VI secretion and phage assembly